MKKVSLLILLVILLSTVLMAAVPVKTVRLTMINKSEYDLYLKLEGTDVTEAFYYLTVPAGDCDAPEVKVFTILVDKYAATLWTCNGQQTAYDFLAVSNTRLTFTPCFIAGEYFHLRMAFTTESSMTVPADSITLT